MPTIKGGCVLINKETQEVALIFRPKFNDYSFPKGHMEEGETVLDCAIRETIEETSRDVEVVRNEPIYLNVYSTPRGEDVECHFYLAVDKGPYQGEIKEEDREICKWFKLDEVEKYLSYENVIDMWNEVKKYIIEEFEK